MKAEHGPPHWRHDQLRKRVKPWTHAIAVVALIWGGGVGVTYMVIAIPSSAPLSDVVASPPPSPTVATAPLATDVPFPAAVPDVRATASSTPTPHASEGKLAENSGRRTQRHSQHPGAAGYSVQVAAVPDLEKARILLEQLRRARYPAYLITTSINRVQLYRVRVGPFKALQKAQQTARRLARQGHRPWITK